MKGRTRSFCCFLTKIARGFRSGKEGHIARKAVFHFVKGLILWVFFCFEEVFVRKVFFTLVEEMEEKNEEH